MMNRLFALGVLAIAMFVPGCSEQASESTSPRVSGRYEVDRDATLAATVANFPEQHREGMRKGFKTTLDVIEYSIEILPDGRFQSSVGADGVTAARRGKWSVLEDVFTLEQTHENDAAKPIKRVGSFENDRLTIRDIDGMTVFVLKREAK